MGEMTWTDKLFAMNPIEYRYPKWWMVAPKGKPKICHINMQMAL